MPVSWPEFFPKLCKANRAEHVAPAVNKFIFEIADMLLDALDDLGPGVPDTRGMEKRGADGVEILVEKAVEACVVPPIAEQLLAAVCASEREDDGGCGEALEHLRALPPTALATALGKAPL